MFPPCHFALNIAKQSARFRAYTKLIRLFSNGNVWTDKEHGDEIRYFRRRDEELKKEMRDKLHKIAIEEDKPIAEQSPSMKSEATKLFATINNSDNSYKDRMLINRFMHRPVSPHVTIYNFPFAAIASVMHRFTGIALSIVLSSIGATSLLGYDVLTIMNDIGSSNIGWLSKIAVGFPFIYHYSCGVRHLVWDNNPKMLETKDVTRLSYIIMGGSIVASVALAFVHF